MNALCGFTNSLGFALRSISIYFFADLDNLCIHVYVRESYNNL